MRILPHMYRVLPLSGVRDQVGHQGKEKTLWLAKQRFYFPWLEGPPLGDVINPIV